MVRTLCFSLTALLLVAGCAPETLTSETSAPEPVTIIGNVDAADDVPGADDSELADSAPAAVDDAAPATVDDSAQQADDAPLADSAQATADAAAQATADDDSESTTAASDDAVLVVVLTPENTKIGFVCNHTGDEPKPRKGSFGKFNGKITVAGEAIEAIEVDIDASSLSTEIGKLTNHLKSPDFFDVRQFPKAKFVSTSIRPGEGETVTIVGDLTLRDQTKSISFPATVTRTDGLQLKSEFTIDRTEFGMDYGIDGVEKLVAMTVTIDS